ncbi:MAG TPA: hypothetical protein VNT20_04270 [Flavisolibacter sp.]|jgi:hypothetical protein|nr:hypothetical protein [Flavisolibacter sp.]
MNEQQFYKAITERSQELNVNPLLLLSGIEGLYTFREVKLNAINYELLDSLILTIFALRIGDQFHNIAQENLESESKTVRMAASEELKELNRDYISHSRNQYLQSFASVLNGKSPIRKYHEKALEVAAYEIKKAQMIFGNDSIGIIILAICKDDPRDRLGVQSFFRA